MHNLNHINFTMKEINDISDSIYEALFEDDNRDTILTLTKRMKELMEDLEDSVCR